VTSLITSSPALRRRARLRKDSPALARAITIASGLGTTSAHTWLKMPSCDEPEVVFSPTSLPCVVVGGVPGPDPAADLASWGRTLREPTVRGLVVGRSLLYPPDNDVFAAVDAAARVVRAARDMAIHRPYRHLLNGSAHLDTWMAST
jgi:Cgl0159-like